MEIVVTYQQSSKYQLNCYLAIIFYILIGNITFNFSVFSSEPWLRFPDFTLKAN